MLKGKRMPCITTVEHLQAQKRGILILKWFLFGANIRDTEAMPLPPMLPYEG